MHVRGTGKFVKRGDLSETEWDGVVYGLGKKSGRGSIKASALIRAKEKTNKKELYDIVRWCALAKKRTTLGLSLKRALKGDAGGITGCRIQDHCPEQGCQSVNSPSGEM